MNFRGAQPCQAPCLLDFEDNPQCLRFYSFRAVAKDVHDQWDSKLVDSLKGNLGPDYEIRYPLMPNEADPDYRTSKAALQKEFAKLDDDVLLVAHSLGGTILVNALVEEPNQRAFGGIFLIAAPFVGEGGWTSDDIELPSNLSARPSAPTPMYLYHGSDDEEVPFGHSSAMRKLFRKLWCAGSRVATIKSMRTCRKPLPISGGVSNPASSQAQHGRRGGSNRLKATPAKAFSGSQGVLSSSVRHSLRSRLSEAILVACLGGVSAWRRLREGSHRSRRRRSQPVLDHEDRASSGSA